MTWDSCRERRESPTKQFKKNLGARPARKAVRSALDGKGLSRGRRIRIIDGLLVALTDSRPPLELLRLALVRTRLSRQGAKLLRRPAG